MKKDSKNDNERLQRTEESAEDCKTQREFVDAVEKGDTETVKSLAQYVDLNEADNDGRSPVHVAALEGHIEIVRFFIAQHVDLNKADKDGQTPVLIAEREGHTEIVKLLAKHNVDLNKADKYGCTPVHIAAAEGHIEIVRFLAAQKVDLNQSNKNRCTPVYAAAQHGHTEIVKFLAAQGVDLDKGARYGHTEIGFGKNPIWIAARNNDTEMVKILMELGAKLDVSLYIITDSEEIRIMVSKALQIEHIPKMQAKLIKQITFPNPKINQFNERQLLNNSNKQ